MTPPIVLKFGGTSVQDAAAFERVESIVRSHGGVRPLVVVSAMSRTTDALLAAAQTAAAGDAAAARDGLHPLLERHQEVARRLLAPDAARTFQGELDHAQHTLADLLQQIARAREAQPALQDEVAAFGEHLSATLLAAVLGARGLPARHVDARRCIVTDGGSSAVPQRPETERRTRDELLPLLDAGAIPVLGGYIAVTASGATTTLGRGGSDYSAALIGAALDAAEIQIWTDTSGMLSADPRIVPEARPVPHLSFAEASELADFGARVLHPKTLLPAIEKEIPVRVLNTARPEDPGSLVTPGAGPADTT